MEKIRRLNKKKRKDGKYQSINYTIDKDRSLPELNTLNQSHPLENLLRFMIPKFYNVYKTIYDQEIETLQPHLKKKYDKYIEFYNRYQSIIQKRKTVYCEYMKNSEKHLSSQKLIHIFYKVQEKIKTKNPELWVIIKKHNFLTTLYEYDQYDFSVIAHQYKKSSIKTNTIAFKIWEAFKKIIKLNIAFASTTRKLNIAERDFFNYTLYGKVTFDLNIFTDYEILYSLIKIANYPIVPYIEGIIENFKVDKTTKFKEQTIQDILKRVPRVKNENYARKTNNEQAYHLWLALRYHKCSWKDQIKKDQVIEKTIDKTINVNQKDAYEVFLKYGSHDPEKFRMLIHNNSQFFKVEEEDIVVYDTITVCENFGYKNPTLQQYHRPLPSRRLFRACIMANVAESKYLKTSDMDSKKEYEDKCLGFVGDKLVHMPHGRSIETIAKKAGISKSTAEKWLKNHSSKHKRIHVCDEFKEENDATNYHNFLEKEYMIGVDFKKKSRYEVYNIDDDSRYIVADTHVSNYYGGTWKYLSKVNCKPNDKNYPKVDITNPLDGQKMKAVAVEYIYTKPKRDQRVEDIEYSIMVKNRCIKSYGWKRYQAIQVKDWEKFKYYKKLQKETMEVKSHLTEELLSIRRIYKYEHLRDSERRIFEKIKGLKLLKVFKTGDVIFTPKLKGKKQVYKIAYQMVPYFLKQLSIDKLMNQSGNIKVGYKNIEYDYSEVHGI